ncbi:glycoside hydrolase family 15 protein [Paralimibaculum aggregatum]|uniref:Glycoside hydrolase family 15 protein n=1 Tax=Paralimibaculum aggregatum TaxID=3036245 RepID=A0ABQ6LHY8_9RHOB|nr:glycoside hydrolase family 15 protein [Limibaculum sp. NKW23]GMG82046.1 glycoside hydrolase family 15 protein [Limibaculum sp. NKW23]
MDYGLIGNCSIAALVDRAGRLVWLCLPRIDGDPVFHALLGHGTGEPGDGAFAVELDDLREAQQSYDRNTAILRTVLHGASGSVEILDWAPRFEARGRMFRPQMLIRQIRPLEGWPRVRLRLRPRFDWGTRAPEITRGSNHVRFIGPDQTLRLTTDAPIDHLLDSRLINLDRPLNFVLGPDESLAESPAEIAKRFHDDTAAYWRGWVRRLAIPLEWQDAVIRAAITLKLCSYEATGGIVAAVTTSLPESPDSGRNWDYRYCWVRDAFFTVRALNSLAAVRTLENYFGWLMNAVADAKGGHIQPVLGVGLETQLTERHAEALQGFMGMGPVRVGNQAHEHFQHDTYGNIILGAAPAFFDSRLYMDAGRAAFEMLEPLGEQSWSLHDQPDAGIWELRTRARIHTSSSLMCWAGCDRLAKIAAHLGLADRARYWAERAGAIRAKILEHAWSDERGAFVESFGGRTLDASVLLMGEIGFLPAQDPRFVATVEKLGEVLGRGSFMLRYEEADDFGAPEVGFNLCAFWRIDALARIGRTEEAREHFEALLNARNHLGLMAEDSDFATGRAWGNFPQTYSQVGIVNGAMRLSKRWEAEL